MFVEGDKIEWDTWCGVARGVVVSVSSQNVSVRSGDGFVTHHPVTGYVSVERIMRGWRPAS